MALAAAIRLRIREGSLLAYENEDNGLKKMQLYTASGSCTAAFCRRKTKPADKPMYGPQAGNGFDVNSRGSKS